MILATNIAAQVVVFLRMQQSLDGSTIVLAYDSGTNPEPVENGVVSVGIKKLSISATNEATISGGEVIPTTDRNFTVELSIKFFVPYIGGSTVGYNLFDKVYTALLFSYPGNKVTVATCGEAEYQRETEAIVIESVVTLTGTTSS